MSGSRPLNSDTKVVFCFRSEAITFGLESQSGNTRDTFSNMIKITCHILYDFCDETL